MKDEEIIDLFWRRDESAISAAAERYEKYCRAIANNILQSREDAEECVNDTWWHAWQAIPPQRPGCLSTYLGRITRNLALNRVKQLNTQKRGLGQPVLALAELEECIPAADNAGHIVEERELSSIMENFLRAQNVTARRIFIARYWYLHSIRDIAHACRMSESRITSLLFRMRKKLKQHLEEEGIIL